MTADWEPDVETASFVTAAGLDLASVVEDFRNYWLNAGRLGADWNAALRNNVKKILATPKLREQFERDPFEPPAYEAAYEPLPGEDEPAEPMTQEDYTAFIRELDLSGGKASGLPDASEAAFDAKAIEARRKDQLRRIADLGETGDEMPAKPTVAAAPRRAEQTPEQKAKLQELLADLEGWNRPNIFGAAGGAE